MTTERGILQFCFLCFLSFSFHVLRCHDENKIEGGRKGSFGGRTDGVSRSMPRDATNGKGRGGQTSRKPQKMLDAGFDGKKEVMPRRLR